MSKFLSIKIYHLTDVEHMPRVESCQKKSLSGENQKVRRHTYHIVLITGKKPRQTSAACHDNHFGCNSLPLFENPLYNQCEPCQNDPGKHNRNDQQKITDLVG